MSKSILAFTNRNDSDNTGFCRKYPEEQREGSFQSKTRFINLSSSNVTGYIEESVLFIRNADFESVL